MSAPTTQQDERLLGLWERPEDAGAPVGCVATTFTFDAAFFEEECLGRFVGMETNPAESGAAYLVEREERLSQVACCVLVDAHHVAAHRSLRWNQLAVRVPRGGILHAKVSLLAWERHVRILVGSANLTEPGQRRNLELVGALDWTPAGGPPLGLLAEVLSFLGQVAGLAAGRADATVGPRAVLAGLLASVRKLSADWPDASWPRGAAQGAFLPVGLGGGSLLDQIRSGHWGGTGPSEATVISPFFDDGDRGRVLQRHLVDHMGAHGQREVSFLVSGTRLPEGRVVLDAPQALATPPQNRVSHRWLLVRQETPEGDVRSLHAKGLVLRRDDRLMHCIGSSNFTGAGQGVGEGPVNVEANLLYLPPGADSAFGRACLASLPPHEELDPEETTVDFAPEVAEQTPEAEGTWPLPEAFGEALFEPDAEDPALLLEILDGAPAGFRLATETGTEAGREQEWVAAGRPRPWKLAWSSPRPPSSLVVEWAAADGDARRSVWPVNVTDASLLPPPEELRNLPLSVLLAILTSSLPIHEALIDFGDPPSLDGDDPAVGDSVLDPHAKVDTSTFLLRRVRRVSAALEGLRKRLERPAHHLEGLRWRLHGPVGPVALAERLAEAEAETAREGAAFMIAEVALTLSWVDWSATERLLGLEATREEVSRVFERLRALAERHPAPKNLAAYVRGAFAEAGP